MRKVTSIWKCKDGTKLRICDMSDQHLTNAIKLLERLDAENVNAAWSALGFLQGEMAQFCCEQDIDFMEETPLEDRLPIYGKLLEELERRNQPN